MSDGQQLIENHVAMTRMITGSWVSQIVRSAADLSLAEHLADGPRRAEEVAAQERADPLAVFRLMRA